MAESKAIGLYIHIPFCRSKCPYCDFYSLTGQEARINDYSNVIVENIYSWANKLNRPADSLYFGGGTPSLASSKNIAKMTRAVSEAFNKNSDKIFEVTVECNPSDTGSENSDFDFEEIAQAGVNRVSLGFQSAIESERLSLGRLSGVEETKRAVGRAKSAGIDNISLDLMLAIPRQSKDSLKKSIDFCAEMAVKHVSAYILSIEESTPFFKLKEKLNLPDEDETADFYLFAAEQLESYGFKQYEISNFALPSYESYHNLKYWKSKDYLGLGPTAHSLIDKERFYFEKDYDAFIAGYRPLEEGKYGGFKEFAMLGLRLKQGLLEAEVYERFGHKIPQAMWQKAEIFKEKNLISISSDKEGFALTTEGFLLSNLIIGQLIEGLNEA